MIISNKHILNINKLDRPYVFIPMAADIVHHGHINILAKGATYGTVIVGLMTDKGLETYKSKPILKYSNRKFIIKAIKYVNYVVPLRGLLYSEIAKLISIDYFVHGTDWKKGPQSKARKKLIQTMNEINGKIIEVKYTQNISSTIIKNKIKY